MNIFLKSYFQYKSESDIDLKWKDYKTISVNNFETVVIKLKNFQSVEDTGLICFKIMSECLAEIEENSAEFIEKTVKYIFIRNVIGV